MPTNLADHFDDEFLEGFRSDVAESAGGREAIAIYIAAAVVEVWVAIRIFLP